MKIRLKILCGLFVVVYSSIIIYVFVTSVVPSFTAGFREGFKSSKNKENTESDINKPLTVKLIPDSGVFTYPTTIQNGNEILNIWIEGAYVKIPYPENLPWYLITFNVFIMITFLFSALISIYIPIESFRIIRSIVRNNIFDDANIHRISRIGYGVLFLFLVRLIDAVQSVITAKQQMINIEHYRIAFPMSEGDTFLLLSGICILIIVEVLKIATRMKEEQDLTV